MKAIPYGRQNITKDDIQAVVDALQSDYLTQGPRISEFEENFKQYVESEYAVAVSNGTAALHLAVMALGIKKGQKVITTPITFAASANCVRYCGGEVVFADIDPETYLIDIESVERILANSTPNEFAGIIPVDFTGRPVDLEKLRKIANQYNLWIIEDACHSPGGYFIDSKGEKQLCGNGKYADLAVFSFHPVKHIAAGEGGMVTTNNEELYKKLLKYRTHGIIKDNDAYINSPSFACGQESNEYPGWYMEMQDLGYNYRITDFQAALGNSQLKKADAGLIRRKEIAERYFNAFKNQDFILGQSGVIEGHAYHLYVIETKDRLELYNYLRTKSIYAQIHYIPCHLMPYYRDRGWKEGDIPIAENYYKHCISLPMYPTLEEYEQSYIINIIKDFYSKIY
ncbi:MAG: UDP-4-amino-4,6-dideoxy-N-acetyl-beta-L-altrosamine transaminase [Chitinophagales bacterium]|nr:UDP-4-amino-4,6-dideoxy-N-acetyl-beta-L-altrosamine transaminase [Chitinophagales bacterium]